VQLLQFLLDIENVESKIHQHFAFGLLVAAIVVTYGSVAPTNPQKPVMSMGITI